MTPYQVGKAIGRWLAFGLYAAFLGTWAAAGILGWMAGASLLFTILMAINLLCFMKIVEVLTRERPR